MHLLGDEPGTGKTIMGGLYAREAQRLGLIQRFLVVCPAHLVTKWQNDFDRFLGGGLRRITAATVREGALAVDHDAWVLSLELAAVNQAVREAIHPDRAGWDFVILDEAHRLTPTAESYHRVGTLLALNTPRTLLMTATPHRGDEWLFRSLMHLVDPYVYPEVERLDAAQPGHRLKPGSVHFLRRMKEELVDYDGTTKLFKPREATNIRVPLNLDERAFYNEALSLVETYFPDTAIQLGLMVYGKRAASCLHSLAETLRRRYEHMGTRDPGEAAVAADPEGEDPSEADLARIVHEGSKDRRSERKAIAHLLDRLVAHLRDNTAGSKWPRLIRECLTPNGITPGNGKQLVVFTEYVDTAEWLVDRFRAAGHTAERYSGRDPHAVRDRIRVAFMSGQFDVIVSTDAGNEGIDLQSAHVLINWDIPWSLVTLEQRMGRIHRVGQDRKVWLYNLVATGTREGDAHLALLDRLVTAANKLDGKMFDCLSLVADNIQLDGERLLSAFFHQRDPAAARRAIDAINADQLRIAAQDAIADEQVLASPVDINAAVDAWHAERLERINPHIVERFLTRVGDTGVLNVELTMLADTGMYYLSGDLPGALHVDGHVLVSTSGKIKADALEKGQTDAARAITLGPAEPSFRDLIAHLADRLRPALYRGGSLVDPTNVTDYHLFAFEGDMTEGVDRRISWTYLVRVDDVGARVVPFEILANLLPGDDRAPIPHPTRITDAHHAAEHRVKKDADARAIALAAWLDTACRQLDKLPGDLAKGIDDPIRRHTIRERAKNAIATRQKALKDATRLDLGEVHQVGWAHVIGTGRPGDPTEQDSETISMTHVTGRLRAAGWKVADVSRERLGYDLLARKGVLQRCVEVKGVWDSASSSGVHLTGNELAKAGLLGDDCWLYVIENCHDGTGSLYAAWQNPFAVFADVARDVAVLQIKGSDLKAAKEWAA